MTNMQRCCQLRNETKYGKGHCLLQISAPFQVGQENSDLMLSGLKEILPHTLLPVLREKVLSQKAVLANQIITASSFQT